jgi:uncharacterized protein involved in outer membrane biogenesis
MFAEVSIPLDGIQQKFIEKARQTSGRDIHIDGEVRLAVSFFPTLVVNELSIPNKPDWQTETFMRVGEARVQIALLPLLKGQLEFLHVAASKVSINLEQQGENRNNWTMTKDSTSDQKPEVQANIKSGEQISDHISIRQFKLADLTIHYRDTKADLSVSNHLETLIINTQERSRLSASLSGVADGIPYSFEATSDLLRNLVNHKPWKLDAEGHIGGSQVSLATEIHTSTGAVEGVVELNVKGVRFGKLLNRLKITDGLDIISEELNIKANLNGASLDEIIDQSTVNVVLNNGAWRLHSHIDDRFKNISFKRATIASIESQALNADFSGKIGSVPVDFVFRTNPLRDFFRGTDEARLLLDAKLGYADVRLSGDVQLPLSSKNLSFDLTVAGDRLDQWNSIMISDLPPFGPYKLTGRFSISPKGFRITDFEAVIANSDLGGTIDIDMTKARPLWNMNLVSNQLQIDDFIVEGYTLVPGKENEQRNSDISDHAETTARQKERDLSKKLDQHLGETREIDRWDIDVAIDARNVPSGNDRLGNGTLTLSASENSFDETVQLSTVGGQIDMSMGLKRADKSVNGYFKLDMDKLNYGILLRRIDPEVEADGLISTRIDLQLAGENFSRRLDRANGMIDFAVWPKNISAGDIDIWALNIFQAVSSSVTSAESQINCAVGLLDIKDGQLNEQFLAVDTTKVWLHGKLDINYPGETVEMILIPRAKKPKFFGIETPVYLKGNLNDKFDMDDLRVKKMDIVKTFFSAVFSPLHVPMRRIFGEKVPEDGSEMCGKLLDRKYVKSIKDRINEEDVTIEDDFSDY